MQPCLLEIKKKFLVKESQKNYCRGMVGDAILSFLLSNFNEFIAKEYNSR